MSQWNRGRVRACLVAAVGSALSGYSLNAATSVDGSSRVSIAFTPYTGSAYSVALAPPVVSGSTPSFQLARTVGSVTADASVGAITTSTIEGFTLNPGTGLAQSSGTGVSDMKLTFTTYFDTSTQFGPTDTGYLSFSLAGKVGTARGDFAKMSYDLAFTNASTGRILRSDATGSYAYTTPGQSFSQGVTNSLAFSPTSLPAGTKVKVSGVIDFQVDPSTITMPRFELSAAPPTSRLTEQSFDIEPSAGEGEPATATGNWFDSTNWETDINPTPIPNGIDQRALIDPDTDPQNFTTINVAQPVTLGSLVIVSPAVSIANTPANPTGVNKPADAVSSIPITFQTTSGNACLLTQNVEGNGPNNASSNIQGDVVLASMLEATIDQPDFYIGGTVSGPGGLIKTGLGAMEIFGANTYTGGTVINSGNMYVYRTGGLGTGSVVINGGGLVYQASHVANGPVQINANGQVSFGIRFINSGYQSVIPDSTDHFDVSDLGAISGSAVALSALTTVNSTFHPGAVIAHQTFDTGAANNPQAVGLAGTTPTYNFGIDNLFNYTNTVNAITVGSLSASPWIGFGGSRNGVIYGSSPTNAVNQTLTLAGDAQIFSLGNQLAMNAPILGAGTLTKRGIGLVALNSMVNTFTGPVTVQSGPLAVNGIFSPTSLTVQRGAALAGAGTINGSVIIQAGGLLSPSARNPVPVDQFSSYAYQTPSTLTVTSLTLQAGAVLNFDLGNNLNSDGSIKPNASITLNDDLVKVTTDLVLDGTINVTDGGDFDPTHTYTLFSYGGTLTDNGLEIGNIPGIDVGDQYFIQVVPNANGVGGIVELVSSVPEPTSLGCLAGAGLLMRRRRSDSAIQI